MEPTLSERCAGIELLVLDVDGVLTDGGIYVDDDGKETKKFHVRDGAGIAYWKRLGKRVAILSGRQCAAVEHRAKELNLDRVYQGRLEKRPVLEEILRLEGLSAEKACFVGDDLADIPAMSVAGLAITVADAAPEVRAVAHWVTQRPGGHGAVREAIEYLLRAQGRWTEVLRHYQRS